MVYCMVNSVVILLLTISTCGMRQRVQVFGGSELHGASQEPHDCGISLCCQRVSFALAACGRKMERKKERVREKGSEAGREGGRGEERQTERQRKRQRD